MQDLRNELKEIRYKIPLNWGKVQNNYSDQKLNIWQIESFEEFEALAQKANLKNSEYDYCLRRWYLYKCSQVDEQIFCSMDGCKANPNSKCKKYDFEFFDNPQMRFDLKSTKLPKCYNIFDKNYERFIVQYYYLTQSKGVRSGMQNRLFLVHHSYRGARATDFLRSNWEIKQKAIKHLTAEMKNIKPIEIEEAKALCLYIIEGITGIPHYYFNSLEVPLV